MATADRLPVYSSNATPEQRVARERWRQEQEHLIDVLIADQVPLQHASIRCGCNRMVTWREMHRCLYCGIWFCAECAQQHFGFRLPAVVNG